MKKTNVPFSFRKGGPNNDIGIWMECFGRDYLLSPQELFLSLLNEEGKIAMQPNPEQYENLGTILYSNDFALGGNGFLWHRGNFSEPEETVIWIATDVHTGDSAMMRFSGRDYIEAVRESLSLLQQALAACNTLKSYENIDTVCINAYLDQFDVVRFVSLNKYHRLLKDAPAIDDFRIAFNNYCCGDFDYTLQLGGHKLESTVTRWATSLSSLRKQLETHRCVELRLEDSPTRIAVQPLAILREKTVSEKGTWYKWEDGLCLVTVTPNEFCKETAFVGICRERQVIKAIYEGLLDMASLEFYQDDEYGYGVNSITFYNQIKSPTVEDFICGRKTNMDNTVFSRQQRIDHVITISPDFDYLYRDEEGMCDGFYDKDTIEIDFEGMEKKTIKIDGFEDWWKKYVMATDFADTTTDPSFDYDAWHERGLVYAKQLREQLPDDIDLWYQAPYEDVKRRKQQAILVYKEYAPIMVMKTPQR